MKASNKTFQMCCMLQIIGVMGIESITTLWTIKEQFINQGECFWSDLFILDNLYTFILYRGNPVTTMTMEEYFGMNTFKYMRCTLSGPQVQESLTVVTTLHIGHTHTAHEELLLKVIFDYPKLSALLQLFYSFLRAYIPYTVYILTATA